MYDVNLLIGGKEQAARGGATFERRNPVSGDVVSRASAATVDDAIAAVTAAQNAFPAWSSQGPGARRAKLNKAADLLEARAADSPQPCAMRRAPPPAGDISTCTSPPRCCAKPRR